MEQTRVLELLKRHGWNATSFQVLEPGFRYWFDGAEACVAYVEAGRTWVAAGAPIAARERIPEVARRFCEWAVTNGRHACFFAVEQPFLQLTSLRGRHIGEQPVWHPAKWEETLRAEAGLREQLRRARAKGITVRQLSAETLAEPGTPGHAELEKVVERWLRSRPMASMGFLVQLHLSTFPKERRCFVAEREGAVVGLLHAVPVYARQGWFFEDLIRDPSAPNGTTELLVDAAMRAAAADGSQYVTLGLAPLSGEVRPWEQFARSVGRAFYDFEGLRAFKAKLRPHAWTSIFLALAPHTGPSRALLDSLRAFTRAGFFRFGLATLMRGPTALIRLMALLLVPWTVLLASASAEAWFPAPWVKWAWVGFDVLLFGGLLWLTTRWRRWLARLLAIVVSFDAALTTLEAACFNFPRASGVADVLVPLVAIAAPSFAAFLLWRAYQHRPPT